MATLTLKQLTTDKRNLNNTHWATVATMIWNAKENLSYTPEYVVRLAGEDFFNTYIRNEALSQEMIEKLISWLGMNIYNPVTASAEYQDAEYISAEFLTNLSGLFSPAWVNTIQKTGDIIPVLLLEIKGKMGKETVVYLDPVSGKKEVKLADFQKIVGAYITLYPYMAYAYFPEVKINDALKGKEYETWWDGFVLASPDTIYADGKELATSFHAPFTNWSEPKLFNKKRTIKDLALDISWGYYNKQKTLHRPKELVRDIVLHETTSWSYMDLPAKDGPNYPHFCVQPDGTISQYFDVLEHHAHVEALSRFSVGIDTSSDPWTTPSVSSAIEYTPVSYKERKTTAEIQEMLDKKHNFSKEKNLDFMYAPGMNQLESLTELVEWLMKYMKMPVEKKTWASYRTMEDILAIVRTEEKYKKGTDEEIMKKVAGKDASLDQELFIIRRLPENFFYKDGIPSIIPYYAPRIYCHGALPLSTNSGNHSDGHMMGLYTWLRIAAGLPKEDAYLKMQDLMNEKRFDFSIGGNPILTVDVSGL